MSKIKSFIKINNLYLATSLIILNYFFNLINLGIVDQILKINYLNFFSTLILFSFFLIISKTISDTLNFSTLSISIVVYLMSFFVFDYLVLFLYKELSFSQNFLITNMAWFIFLLLNKGSKFYLLFSIFVFFILNIFNNVFKENLNFNVNLNGDVEAVFLPQSKLIYENSFYYSMNNPIHSEGYPQFSSYIQSVVYKLSFFNSEVFEYFTVTTNVFILLTLLLYFELNISTFKKYLLSISYVALILNSKFLDYLFSNSLMSEGLVSYFFVVIIISILKYLNSKNELMIVLFFSGWLIFSKQFFSTLIVIFLFYFCIRFLNYRYLFLSFFALAIRQLSFLTYFSQLQNDHHLNQIDIQDTLLDLVLFRDLNLQNIQIIFGNLLEDKPVSFIFILSIIICIYKICRNFDLDNIFSFYIFFIALNLLLILLLYVSAWRNMELESPIRYILNLLPLYFITIFQNNIKIKKL